MVDTKMSEKLWRDCKSDQERADFILCGRAHETGVIATSIQSEVAMAFQRLATLQSLTSINFTLPNHEPTIAIGEILDGYDGDDRDDVWESIKAYADVHARSALEATTPADAALADALEAASNRCHVQDVAALRKASAALRARPQAVAEGKQYHDVAQRLYELLDNIDTASDVAKSDDKLYRGIVERTQAKKRDYIVSCDGYTVVLADDSLLAASQSATGTP